MKKFYLRLQVRRVLLPFMRGSKRLIGVLYSEYIRGFYGVCRNIKENDSANARVVNDISFPELPTFKSNFTIISFSGHLDGGGHRVHLDNLFGTMQKSRAG